MITAASSLAVTQSVDTAREAPYSRATKARATSGRRQNVNPTTCDRERSAAEVEFTSAIDRYKLSSGRMFPTWSEVLEVIHALGYQKNSRLPASHRGN